MSWSDVKSILSHHKGWKKYYFILALLMLFLTAIKLYSAYLTHHIIDEMQLEATLIVLLAIVVVINVVFPIIQSAVQARIFYRISLRFRTELLDGLLKAPYSFSQRYTAGDLNERFSSDLDAVVDFFTYTLFKRLLYIIQAFSSAVYCFFLSWQLALISFVLSPILLLVSNFISKKIQTALAKLRVDSSDSSTVFLNILKGQQMIKGNSLQARFDADFRAVSQKIVDSDSRRKFFNELNMFVIALGFLCNNIGTIFIGGYFVNIQLISIGTWTAYYYNSHNASGIMDSIPKLIQAWREASVSYRRIKEFDAPPLEDGGVEREAATEESAGFSQAVAFQHVCFRYPETESQSGQPLVLDDFSLRVGRGEKVAIVGKSGCGKSTLFQLLCRFYEIESGRILLDGADIAGLPVGAVRERLAVVDQKSYLFSADEDRDRSEGNLLRNIAYGRAADSEFDEETVGRVKRAAALAAIGREIEALPAGYLTPAGEYGGSLSGGQRQRVCIARALYRQAPLLCLDEATAATDEATEKEILQAVCALEGVTVLAVTHRLQSCAYFDRVVVVDAGRIVQDGSFAELSRQDGLFAQLLAVGEGGAL